MFIFCNSSFFSFSFLPSFFPTNYNYRSHPDIIFNYQIVKINKLLFVQSKTFEKKPFISFKRFLFVSFILNCLMSKLLKQSFCKRIFSSFFCFRIRINAFFYAYMITLFFISLTPNECEYLNIWTSIKL